ncbi:creatininase family protein [Streptomyces sp. NBC_01210]|uniref:creatininase family protein n=1 Tax=Streptomyces sp. NBC_01210 TaxID=2903774 RepID=UPI002E0E26F4|nr:creatininase family protein [Streptomyces sp. NBC_01210]
MNDGYSIFARTIADLTYPEVEAAAERGACVLLPTGVIEQHGPHLPLGTDAYGAYQLCRLVMAELEQRGVEALIAPPVFWGINQVSSAFAGTFRTRPETAVALHTDILDSLATDGFDRIFVINHQGDIAHNQMLLDVVQRQHEQGRAGVVLLEPDFIADRLGCSPTPALASFAMQPLFEGLELTGELGVHAEEIESALMMRWFPELVDYDAMAGLKPTGLSPDDLAEWRKGGEHARRVTPQGFFGAPSPRDPFLWRFHQRMAAAMADLVTASLSPSHRAQR